MQDLLEFFRALVEKKLTAERYRHTLGVERIALKLAGKYGIDRGEASLAAITHDLAKSFSLAEQLEKAGRWNLLMYPEDREIPDVIHGRIAAYILEHEYGINDRNVLDAVRNHTLGRPGMTPLEMLIYSSDMVEPGRYFDGVDKLREKLYHDLKEGTLACVKHTLDYLKGRNRPVHPLTVLTYQDLKNNLKYHP